MSCCEGEEKSVEVGGAGGQGPDVNNSFFFLNLCIQLSPVEHGKFEEDLLGFSLRELVCMS